MCSRSAYKNPCEGYLTLVRTGIYPGTFDPITNGHVDIIERAAKVVDRLIVAIAFNSAKSPLFSAEVREAQVRRELAGLPTGACEVLVVRFDHLLIKFAQEQGAQFILTPEVTNCVSASRTQQNEVLAEEAADKTLAAFREDAARLGVHLLIGSLALKAPRSDDTRFVNRSFLIDPAGDILARYDKIHMFDVAVSETETYRESDGYRPGDRAVIAEIDGVSVGLTICYDVRFPGLYRTLAEAGAEIITVPSAFSPVTGAAHWESLLRARAIETGSMILAPAQTGTHAASRGRARTTHGHSLAVGPWGEILGDGGDLPGVTLVDFSPGDVKDCRQRIPALCHGRQYKSPA